MGFFSKIKEAILGESVENDNLLNEDVELNEAEALEEDYSLDEEMDYVDEALAGGDTIFKRTHDYDDFGKTKSKTDEETLLGKQKHSGVKPLFIDRKHSTSDGYDYTETLPYHQSSHSRHGNTDEDEDFGNGNTRMAKKL